MTYYKHGDANAICDRCGFKYKLSMLKKEWTGSKTCNGPGTNNCWEPRHPQDFVRGRADKQTVHDPRPEGTDTFLTAYTWNDDTKAWEEA